VLNSNFFPSTGPTAATAAVLKRSKPTRTTIVFFITSLLSSMDKFNLREAYCRSLFDGTRFPPPFEMPFAALQFPLFFLFMPIRRLFVKSFIPFGRYYIERRIAWVIS
jgi:hypothetical protein